MRAAIYARKSTDEPGRADDAKSITRQVDHARAYATRKGWTVDEAHVYVDDGISGAEFVKRPGLARLMNALRPRPPFQVLVMAEESRLGREAIETGWVLKQITEAGVRVFFYLEDRERSLDTAMDKVMLALTSFASEMEREKARQRTYDAMLRKARALQVTGGVVYGYDNVPVLGPPGPDGSRRRLHVLREVNADQATVVRRIFELCAAGAGLTKIAKTLNTDGVPPPRAGRSGWAPTAIREMLHRPLYRGEVLWNQRQTISRGGRAKVRRRRPASEWIRLEAPELRIVAEPLWAEAHAQIEARAPGMAGAVAASGRVRAAGTPAALLSGLARCARCGGPILAITRPRNGQRQHRYGCGYHWKRGDAVCRNDLEIPAAVMDQVVVRAIARALEPAILAEAVELALAELRAGQVTALDRRGAIVRELSLLEARGRRLAESVAQGQPMGPLVAALRADEQRKAHLTADLAALGDERPTLPTLTTARLRRQLQADAQAIRAQLGADPAAARAIVAAAVTERLICTPVVRGSWRGYAITGLGTYAPLLAGLARPPYLVSPTRTAQRWPAWTFRIRAFARAA
jgi:DNA invertase Pin-like site-specific DNA recombinase